MNSPTVRANHDNGTVLVTRSGAAIEQRTIRVRYTGRLLLSMALFITSITLAFIHRDNYALLTMTANAALLANLVARYRRGLLWATGYDTDSRKS